MNSFIRLSDLAWVTELEIDPFCVTPNPDFRPNEAEYAMVQDGFLPKPAIDETEQVVVEVHPVLKNGVWTRQWELRVKFDNQEDLDAARAAKFASDKAAFAKTVNDYILAVYARPMTLSEEYRLREADAIAYRDAGYAGDVPPRVNGFATSAGMDPTPAANLILSQAVQLRAALTQLSDIRMRKYEILRATTIADATLVYDSCMASIRAIATAIA